MPQQPVVFRFRYLRDHYRLDLEGEKIGERTGHFVPPYDTTTWDAIWRALDPAFNPETADPTTLQILADLGDPTRLHWTAGTALADALLADESIRLGFNAALNLAEESREPLPVELHFDAHSADLAALPWELWYYQGRFLVADTSIALSRYPEGNFPAVSPLTELPLRVLLVLSEPLDASPILPQAARRELLHGLRALDEQGAIIVDELRPPTYRTLVEAVTNGEYHLLIFYGHGAHGEVGGLLLFEDDYGGQELVSAVELGRALRNTSVRLVLLGACQSAVTSLAPVQPAAAGEAEVETGRIWQGTAQALICAGVPLVVGMQLSIQVDAVLAFIRQFALSLSAGKPIIQAVADGRRPIGHSRYGGAWFIPAFYGRPKGESRLFAADAPLPDETATIRAEMKRLRIEIDDVEKAVSRVGTVGQSRELARLRQARAAFVQQRAQLARQTPGGYAAVVSPLYGVPSNPVFKGRGEDLVRVSRYLEGEQPVVIWGTGGIGKTALAIEVAHRGSWRFPAGVLWLDCRGVQALDSLLEQIGGFCGLDVRQLEPERKVTDVRYALAGLGERCLLIWDNAEDVWGQRAVQDFIHQLPGNCQVLLTTREDPEQAMWPKVEVTRLTQPAMTSLFYDLAVAAGVRAGSQADLDAIPAIIGWLQGHPLALTLVVPLAARRGLRRVWQELQQRSLTGIDAALATSYDRLTKAQQQLFRSLSVFTIPFEREAAAALLPEMGDPDVELDVLLQRKLVDFDGARCHFHSLVRQYAYEKLCNGGEAERQTAHERAAAYLQALAEQRSRTPEESLEEVDQWERAGQWEKMAWRVMALVDSLMRLGYWGEIGARLEGALAAVKTHLETPSRLEAALLNGMAAIPFRQAKWEQATKLFQQSLEIKKRVGDIDGMATTFMNLGSIYLQKGESKRAIELYEQSLEMKEQVGDIHGKAQILDNLGSVYLQMGERERAIELYEQSLEIKKQVGDILGMATTLGNLGIVHRQKGESKRAIELYEQSLEIKEQVGDIYGKAQTLGNLGLVYADIGEWEQAIELYQQSLETMERVGDIHGKALTLGNLGYFYQAQGDLEQAKPYAACAYLIFSRLGAAETQQAARLLLNLLGTPEAVQTYLEQFTQGSNHGR